MSISNIVPLKPFQSHIFILFLLLYLLSGCAYSISPATLTNGPIQLYDVHNRLLCQLHGQKSQLDCLAKNGTSRQFASQYIDYTVSELASDLHVSSDRLPSSALHISTTLDLDLQRRVLQKTQQYIASMADTHHMTNAAAIILDYHNGAIRSLIGSLDSPTTDNPLNVVTQKGRQIGSAFKPFVYATAFEQGISPGEVVYDGPFSVGSPPYTPLNYDQKYHGYLSYRAALQQNLNIPTLKLSLKTGFAALRQKALALGIKAENLTPLEKGWYSASFGIMDVPLLDTTVAYGAMANGGIRIPPHTIEKISTSDGHIIYTVKPQGIRALSPEAAFMITDVMSDNTTRPPEESQCSPYILYTTTAEQCKAGNQGSVRPAAVHSGANDSLRDTLAVGYTSDLVAGTWTGNTDFLLLVNVSTLDGAPQLWHDSMLLAEANTPITPFPGAPSSIVKKTMSYSDLTTTDWYLAK